MAIMRWDPFAEVDRMFELLNGQTEESGQRANEKVPAS